MSDNLHVMHIKGTGFLNLKVVDITLGKGVVDITGKNRQGKSNILKLIEMFNGKSEMPDIPLNTENSKGKFEVTLADEDGQARYLVKYKFSRKTSTISFEDVDGNKQGIEVLKSILSPCIDPFRFFLDATATGNGAKGRRDKAIAVLRKVMVLQFDSDAFLERVGLSENEHVHTLLSLNDDDPIAFLDALDAYHMDNNKAWKERLAEEKAIVSVLQKDIPVDKRDVVTVDVFKLLQKQKDLSDSKRQHELASDHIATTKQGIVDLEADLFKRKQSLAELKKEEAALLPLDVPALQQLEQDIKNVNDVNAIAQKVSDLKEAEAKVERFDKGVEDNKSDIEVIRQEKLKVMNEAKMPIEGLSIQDGTIMKNGLPLGQDSTEEGITDSLMIGLAYFDELPPDALKLKTMIIPNASLLDSASIERLKGLAEEHGVQIILELVLDERKQGVIFVEDGVAEN